MIQDKILSTKWTVKYHLRYKYMEIILFTKRLIYQFYTFEPYNHLSIAA